MFFPLLFSSRLFVFFPLPTFYGAPPPLLFPLPPRLFLFPLTDLLDLGASPEGDKALPMCNSLRHEPLQPNLLIKTLQGVSILDYLFFAASPNYSLGTLLQARTCDFAHCLQKPPLTKHNAQFLIHFV